jgi:hypothetical protein
MNAIFSRIFYLQRSGITGRLIFLASTGNQASVPLYSNRQHRHSTAVYLSARMNDNPNPRTREARWSHWRGGSVYLVRISVVVKGHDGAGDHLTLHGPGAWHRDAQCVVRNRESCCLADSNGQTHAPSMGTARDAESMLTLMHQLMLLLQRQSQYWHWCINWRCYITGTKLIAKAEYEWNLDTNLEKRNGVLFFWDYDDAPPDSSWLTRRRTAANDDLERKRELIET